MHRDSVPDLAGQIVVVDDIDPGVHNGSAQQYESGETALVERISRNPERQEHPDKRNRDQRQNNQRFGQRLEKHRAAEIDDRDYQQDQPILAIGAGSAAAPVVAVRLGFETDRQHFVVETFHFRAGRLLGQFVRPDEIIGNDQPVLLVILVNVVSGAPFGDIAELGKPRVLPVHPQVFVRQTPYVETVALRRHQRHRQAGLPVEIGTDVPVVQLLPHRIVQAVQVDTVQRDPVGMEGDVKLVTRQVVSPSDLPVNPRIAHALVFRYLLYDVLRITVQLIVIVAGERDPVRLIARIDVIVEPVLVDPVDSPCSSAVVDGLADYRIFQEKRKTGMLRIFLKRNFDRTVVVPVNTRLEHVDLVELAQEVFHHLHDIVELLHGTSFRHRRSDAQRRPLRLPVIISSRHVLHKEPQAPAERLLDDRLHVFLIPYAADRLVICLRPPLVFLIRVGLDPLGQQVNRQPESQDHDDDKDPFMSFAEQNVSPVNTVEPQQSPHLPPGVFTLARSDRQFVHQRRHENQRHDD